MTPNQEENTAKMEGGLYMSCLCGKHKSDSQCPVYLANNPKVNQEEGLREGRCKLCNLFLGYGNGEHYCKTDPIDVFTYNVLKRIEDKKITRAKARQEIKKFFAHQEAVRDTEILKILNHPKFKREDEVHCTCLPCAVEEIEALIKNKGK